MKIKFIGGLKTVMSNRDSMHNYFGWPTSVRLKNGKIAVGASGFRLGHVCPFGKSVISYSDDDGETYTAPAAVIDTVLDDRDVGLCPFGDNGLIFTSFNNTVEFQRKTNQKCADSTKKAYIDAYLDNITKEAEQKALGNTYRISNDHGVSFGPLLKSPISSPHGPIELKSGNVLWVGTSYKNGYDIMAYELDPTDGKMEYIGEIDTSSIKALGRIPCEPYAIELDNGIILCHIRADRYDESRAFTLYQSESSDGGKTWSEPIQILEDRGGAPSHILKHSSGVLIATYGYRSLPYGIKVMFSHDGGKSWGEEKYLYSNDISGDLGYPSTVELLDGSLLTVFYAKLDHDGEALILAQKWCLGE